jgi:UDP-2-acetamido-2,6-beta-L-arabino-hexul-4-ose reductase
MRVLVTGSDGFIGKNLIIVLKERAGIDISCYVRDDSSADLFAKVAQADFVFHLAGVNRPQHEVEFAEGNYELTNLLCEAVRATGRSIPIVYTSSVQVERGNAYGMSKRSAEQALIALAEQAEVPVWIYRLPNVFGKWCRPHYNSVVATFCHNLVHGLPIEINDPAVELRLVYIDDVVAAFLSHLDQSVPGATFAQVQPIYETTVGDLADQLKAFKLSRTNMVIERVGNGFLRALYATYISYYPPSNFVYPLVKHEDPRGCFAEMLKTKDSGQFSFFTAYPGVTRGGHYHHTKNEKFLVVQGTALFKFRHVVTGEEYELCTKHDVPQVVETVPGWSHDITNIGENTMIVMLWANEIFDPSRPDTKNYEVRS